MWLLPKLGDLLSPPSCAACDAKLQRSTAVFCRACATTVELESDPFLLEQWPVIALGSFGGALATAIRRLKYEDCPDLARPLGHLLGQACRQAGLSVDLVIPVPLHVGRLAARGYNQAALIAGSVARLLRAKLCTGMLVRTTATAAQARLVRSARERNVARAFQVSNARRLRGRRVLLVDDVTTTGATLLACFSLIAGTGATSIAGAVAARTRAVSRVAP